MANFAHVKQCWASVSTAGTNMDNLMKNISDNPTEAVMEQFNTCFAAFNQTYKDLKLVLMWEGDEEGDDDQPRKRKRATTTKKSSNLSLEELWESLDFKNSPFKKTFDINNLHLCSTSLDKLQVLKSWEKQSNTLHIAVVMQMGFYLQSYKATHSDNDFEVLCTKLGIGRTAVCNRISLYNNLGHFRSILHSTIQYTTLLNGAKHIKQCLEKLSDVDRMKWVIPPERDRDISCFFYCCKIWYKSPLEDIFQKFDLLDNDPTRFVCLELIEKYCTDFTGFITENIPARLNTALSDIAGDMCMIWAQYKNQFAHCVLIKKDEKNKWESFKDNGNFDERFNNNEIIRLKIVKFKDTFA